MRNRSFVLKSLKTRHGTDYLLLMGMNSPRTACGWQHACRSLISGCSNCQKQTLVLFSLFCTAKFWYSCVVPHAPGGHADDLLDEECLCSGCSV